MRKFEKKYSFGGSHFEVDKNLKKEHLDALNKNKSIRLTSVSGGMESPSHIIFEMGNQNNLTKAESYLKKKIPNSKVDCFGTSRGGYNLNHQNKDAHGKTRKPIKKYCSVVSKKKKSPCFWKRAAKIIAGLR